MMKGSWEGLAKETSTIKDRKRWDEGGCRSKDPVDRGS